MWLFGSAFWVQKFYQNPFITFRDIILFTKNDYIRTDRRKDTHTHTRTHTHTYNNST